MSHIPKYSHVVYYFGYVQSKSKLRGDTPRTIMDQGRLVHVFEKVLGWKEPKPFTSLLTNRDRHFANTIEFRTAVAFAAKYKIPLVIADLYSLLRATHPDLISAAVSTVFGAGVRILNAAAGGEMNPATVATLVAAAKGAGLSIRNAIKKGLPSGLPRSPTTNQVRAAHGAKRAADIRALNLKDVVNAIADEFAKERALSPTVLAKELNTRGILASRGGTWTAGSARNLLKRLSR